MTAPTRRQMVLNRLGLGLVVVTFLGGIVSAWEWNRQTDCMRTYVERNAQVSIQLRQAREADQAAVDAMVTGVLEAKPGEGRAVLEKYRATRAEADKKRAENPAPPPPSQLCD